MITTSKTCPTRPVQAIVGRSPGPKNCPSDRVCMFVPMRQNVAGRQRSRCHCLTLCPWPTDKIARRREIFNQAHAHSGVQCAVDHAFTTQRLNWGKRRVSKHRLANGSFREHVSFTRPLTRLRTAGCFPTDKGLVAQAAMQSVWPTVLETNAQSSLTAIGFDQRLLVVGMSIAFPSSHKSRSEGSAGGTSP